MKRGVSGWSDTSVKQSPPYFIYLFIYYKEYYLLWSDFVQSDKSSHTLRKKVLPPFSGSKISQQVMCMARERGRESSLWAGNWKAHCRKWSWPNLMYYPCVCLERLHKPIKSLRAVSELRRVGSRGSSADRSSATLCLSFTFEKTKLSITLFYVY